VNCYKVAIINERSKATCLLHGAESFLTGSQIVKKFPAFYGTRRFITAITSARHLSLSWARSIPSVPPHTTSWRSVLIVSSHLHLGLPRGLFLSGVLTKTLYTPPSPPPPHPLHAPARIILLDFITRTILDDECRTLSSSFCSFLHSLVEVTQSNYKRWQHILYILHDQKMLRTLWWMFCTTTTTTITVITTIIIIIITALVYLHTGSIAPMSTTQAIRVLCNIEAPSCLRAARRDTEFACVR
jgi:hypothetical protein